VTAWPERVDSETVNEAGVFPAFPSATETSAMASEGGGSLSTIVPIPVPSAMPAPLAPERSTKKFSLASLRRSPAIGTAMDFEVVPGGKVSVPDTAV
jgi:hypothetical protein